MKNFEISSAAVYDGPYITKATIIVANRKSQKTFPEGKVASAGCVVHVDVHGVCYIVGGCNVVATEQTTCI